MLYDVVQHHAHDPMMLIDGLGQEMPYMAVSTIINVI